MSLIDDALKRAREEAARQEAARRSSPSRWAPSHVPGARPSSWKAAAALTGVFLAGCGAAWLLVGRVPAPRLPAETEAKAVPPVGATHVADRERPASKTIDRAPAPIRRPRFPSDAPHGSTTLPQPAGVSSEGPAPESASRENEKTAGPARKTFVRRAAFPGGETIELGGIVYTEGSPVALINGKVVAPGGSVGNFTVVQIRPEGVDFAGDGTTFSILLR